jgi:hypothetical protein
MPRSRRALAALLLLSACTAPPEPPSPAPVEAAPAEEGPAATGTAGAALAVSGCRALLPAAAIAIGHDGNAPGNTLDDDLATRWSHLGKGSWIQYDLGAPRPLEGAAVAWHQGAARTNAFSLSVSADGATFTPVFTGRSSGTTTAAETYRFPARTARFLRVTVDGNSLNDWASIAEARACEQALTDEGPALPRLPYLQSVTPTRALVAFRTGVSCTPLVRWGRGDALDRTALATAAGWRHAVRLEGLEPGERHSYVVEACGSRTAPRSFLAAPAPGASRVRFAALGDFGTGGSAQAQVLAALDTPAFRPELLLALGDNAYSSGTEAEFQERLFKPMASLLRQVPLFASLGNHEYVTAQGQPYLDNLYLPANNPERTERYYSFDWGPVHFVALDSNCVIGLATADRCTLAAQKAWAEADLSASRAPWKVVFFHHPPWSSGEHGPQLKMRREFAPLFERHGVDLVLTGHDHDYERSRPVRGDAVAPAGTPGVPYLVVGSGGASLRPFPSGQPAWTAFRTASAHGFLDVAVDGGTLRARFLSPAGAVLDALTLTKTLPAAGATAGALPEGEAAAHTPPGPRDDPAVPPEGLLQGPAPLPPVDDSDAPTPGEPSPP